jgi:hypothetical protein
MRLIVLLSCLAVGVASAYAQVASNGAARTTEPAQVTKSSLLAPLLTEDQVNSWVRTWQRRLGLEDWVIEAKIVRLASLPKGTIANIHWSLPKRKASIKVLDSIDSTLPKSEIVRDTELSVVHELIHLSMAKLPLDSNHTELEEEAVKKISSALLALDDKERK